MSVKMIQRLILVLALGAVACSQPGPSDDNAQITKIPNAREALSEGVMIFLGQAKNYHKKADVYLKEGRLVEAIAAMEAILNLKAAEPAPEVEDVILDANARLAKLLTATGDIDRALKLVDDAIAAATRDSFFLANLHTVRGEVFEAKAEQSVDNDLASQYRRSAIDAFDRSIQINTALQQRLMEGEQ